jgi:hypothetical protein
LTLACEEFRSDLQSFVIGETMTLRNGKLVIGRPLYKRWLDKIRTRGFDYEIDFKYDEPDTMLDFLADRLIESLQIKIEYIEKGGAN